MAQDTSSQKKKIEITKVSKSYPPNVTALTDISFSMNKGEKIFLTGRSGAGKTTLLKIISRIELPTRGFVEIDGIDITKLPKRKLYSIRRKIGMAYQDFKLLPDRTVATNIAFSMEVVYRKKAFITMRTRELLQQLDLQSKINTPAAELSRGEQQRVTIARAVANYPDIILADEPTGNLDGETTTKVMELFDELHKKGTTLLIATHDTSIFDPASDRVIHLHHGKKKQPENNINQVEAESPIDQIS